MKKKLLIGVSGSFCNHALVLSVLKEMIDEYELSFVFTKNVSELDTRFHTALEFHHECALLTNEKIIQTIVEAEKIGPLNQYDLMAILPCTANLLSRLVHARYDCPVALCAKAMIRNQKNVVIGISSNDCLGLSGENLMKAMNMKHFYLVPFFQDDPLHKPNSCMSDYTLVQETIENAFNQKQIQPVIREKKI